MTVCYLIFDKLFIRALQFTLELQVELSHPTAITASGPPTCVASHSRIIIIILCHLNL